MVLWLCQHGIMPLYTPLGGSWLNMAEAIQRILKRRTLDGQQPQTPEEIGTWFEQTAQHWNRQPTPFIWNGKHRQRRRRAGDSRYRLARVCGQWAYLSQLWATVTLKAKGFSARTG